MNIIQAFVIGSLVGSGIIFLILIFKEFFCKPMREGSFPEYKPGKNPSPPKPERFAYDRADVPRHSLNGAKKIDVNIDTNPRTNPRLLGPRIGDTIFLQEEYDDFVLGFLTSYGLMNIYEEDVVLKDVRGLNYYHVKLEDLTFYKNIGRNIWLIPKEEISGK